jgi:hypothetical protein
MRRAILCALFVAACGDDAKQPLRDDAGAGPADAASDGGSPRLTGCLDTPGVARAPAGQLPCDLVPPGRQL